MQHIPYKGVAPAINDVLGGQVPLAFASLPSALNYIKTGKLRALAVTSRTRSSALPEVPTAIEQGLRNFEVIGWFGLMTPASTPSPIVARLNTELNQILRLSDMRDKLSSLGLEAGGGTPEEFQKLIESDTLRYGEAIRRMGIKVD